jgi:acyl-CoA synthetase (NDP forming)
MERNVADGVRELFAPHSIAIVGASDDPSKWGNWLARQALSGDTPVHLVNARASEVLGRRTVPSLREIPGGVGLVVVAVPAAAFESTVEDALAMHAKAIVGISAGLGESGAEGQRHERQIVERVRSAGAVLLGPNCLGVFDAGSRLQLTTNPFPAGRVAFISQSGNLSLELAQLLEEHALGFSRFASLGNQADLDAADLVAACAEHPETDVIAVYCEDFRDGRRFVEASRLARAHGKAVVLLTVGASEAAARQASSHTASLVSSSAVVDAACAAGGIVRVHTPQQMADVVALLSTSMRPAGPRLAVLTDGGGHASIAADVAASFGLRVPEFSDGQARAVAAELPPAAATVNPVDVAGGGEQDISCFSRVTKVVLAGGEVDSLVLSGYFGGYVEYSPDLGPAEVETAEALAAAAHSTGRVVVVHSMYPKGIAANALRTFGVPVYRSIESAVGSLAAVATQPPLLTADPVPGPAAPVRRSDYWSAREQLMGSGLRFPDAVHATSREQVASAGDELPFPVVLKAMGLLHKSDAGGVVLGIPDKVALMTAYDDLTARLGPPSVTVEQMLDTRDGVELIVGARQDPRFGPVVMVGLGGIFTEVLSDVATGLAPVDEAGVATLLNSLRGAPLLDGPRGRPIADRTAIAEAVCAIGAFAAEHPEITELEVNPLLATAHGVWALDARFILTQKMQEGSL